MIYYLTPFSSEKRLGHIHNEYCRIVPHNEDYICLLDPDTMFLHPHQQTWIEDIIKVKGNDWDLLGCMTNRIGNHEQVYPASFGNETNVSFNMVRAEARYKEFATDISPATIIAGFLMIFRKSLWNKIKFQEGINFDIKFCEAVRASGGEIGIMKGIYVWHSYRLGHENPKSYKKHLL